MRTQDTAWLQDEVPQLRKPMRLVWGAADTFQSIEYARRLGKELNAPHESIEGGKHFVPEDHPDRIALAVVRLSEELRVGLRPRAIREIPSEPPPEPL